MILWVPKLAVLGIHQDSLDLFGGLPGTRDDGALEAALARPENKHAYGENDLSALAAAYAFGIIKNHPFADGNKRTALGVAIAFLGLNGNRIIANKIDLTTAVFQLAASDISEDEFAKFICTHLHTRR